MALIAVTTAGKIEVVQSIEQDTQDAIEPIVAGAPVRYDTTTGQFTNANGTTAPEVDVYGIALRTVPAGMPVTAIRQGVLDGFTFTQNYSAAIFVADTDGRLGDVAGTQSVKVGRIIPGSASTLGTAKSKLLLVNLGN